MQTNKPNLIVDLTFEFALDIIEFTELLESKRKYNMANQLFKSGTSIGAIIRESQNAESKNDFIHKIKIAAKEADETTYWLLLSLHSKSYPNPDALLKKIESINKVLAKIIGSSKSSKNNIETKQNIQLLLMCAKKSKVSKKKYKKIFKNSTQLKKQVKQS